MGESRMGHRGKIIVGHDDAFPVEDDGGDQIWDGKLDPMESMVMVYGNGRSVNGLMERM